MQKNGMSIPEIVNLVLKKKPDKDLVDLAKSPEFRVELTDQNIKRLGKVVSGGSGWFKKLFKGETEAGFDIDEIKAYFPMVVGETGDRAGVLIQHGRTQVVVPKEELTKKLLGKSWKDINDIPLGVGGNNLPVKPAKRYSNVIAARTKSAYSKVNVEQWLENNKHNIKLITANDPKLEALFRETDILKTNPQLAYQLAMNSRKYREGIPTGHGIKPEEGIRDALKGMIRADSAEDVTKRLKASLDTIKVIDKDTYQGVEALYDEVMDHWRLVAQRGAALSQRAPTHAQEILSSLQANRSEFLDKVSDKILDYVIRKNLASAGRSTTAATQLYGRVSQASADLRNKLGKKAEGQLQPLLDSVGISDNLTSLSEEAVRGLSLLSTVEMS